MSNWFKKLFGCKCNCEHDHCDCGSKEEKKSVTEVSKEENIEKAK
jgi:hypothetical protein